jgi:hypothetical protein
VSLLGEVELVRSYYHCRACGQGHLPWERTLGLGAQRLTAAAREVVSMLGVQSSFAEVSERTLRKACGLRLSDAQEHLLELGKALYGEESAEGKQWLDERCHQLKAEGGAAVRAGLEALDVSTRSEAVREVNRRETNYFRNHEHKMDYPHYLRQGWQIGSGPVESACKTADPSSDTSTRGPETPTRA